MSTVNEFLSTLNVGDIVIQRSSGFWTAEDDKYRFDGVRVSPVDRRIQYVFKHVDDESRSLIVDKYAHGLSRKVDRRGNLHVAYESGYEYTLAKVGA